MTDSEDSGSPRQKAATMHVTSSPIDAPRRREILPPTFNSPTPSNPSSFSRLMGSRVASWGKNVQPKMSARQVWDEFREAGPMTPAIEDNSKDFGSPKRVRTDDWDGFEVIVDDGRRVRRQISLSTDADLLDDLSEPEVSSSEDEEDHMPSPPPTSSSRWWKWSLSPVQQAVLKSSIAYFIASMATFVPYLNDLIGEGQNQHMVATVCVYFLPSRTMGSMIEATGFALLAFIFGMFVSIGSMATATWFNDHDLLTLGHIFTLVFWCAGSIACIAYGKAKLAKPSFNTACSLCSIIIFVVLTKEGAVHLGEFSTTKILQVTWIVSMGVIITNVVCFGLWTKSAALRLEAEIQKTLDSFSLLLKLLTKTFLLDPSMSVQHDALRDAIAAHKSTFTALQSALSEAKMEFGHSKLQRSRHAYDDAVRSMQQLAQHLMGLRSSCGLQGDMLQKQRVDIIKRRKLRQQGHNVDAGSLTALEDFVDHVGPHMKALAYTSKRTLMHLRRTFHHPPHASMVSFDQLDNNLNQALELFQESQSQAILRLYKQKRTADDTALPFNDADEEISLIYFFVFNLEGFARELVHLVDITEVIVNQNTAVDSEDRAWKALPWYIRWSGIGWFRWKKAIRPIETKRRYSHFDRKPVDPKANPFPKNSRNTLATVHTPLPSTLKEKFKNMLWRIGKTLRSYEVKFAVKAGLGSAILATPAFINSTRPIFREYRMEWALVSFAIVISPTVGATNKMAFYRLVGTAIGCTFAFGVYSLFPDNIFVLPWIGFFFVMPCFYVILFQTAYASLARFTLLSYNLVCLYAYNARELHLHIETITYHRAVAVAIGVLWGLIVTAYWWPYVARKELRKGLTEFFLNTGWMYNKLVAVYSTKPEEDESSALIPTAPQESIKDFMDMELFLQLQLINLQKLLNETTSEPRLKGPFPVVPYRRILASCQNIMDKLLNIRLATTNETFKDVRRDFIVPVNHLRRDMVGNILLFFFILASSMRLKTPLPAYLPPVRAARDRLVEHIRKLPVVQARFTGHNSQYIVYYAYTLMMKDVTDELERLGAIMQELFGVIGGQDAFEELFA